MPKPRFVMFGGFLGAGKTTAILRLAEHLAALNLRSGLITNDQSVNLVDTARVRAAGFPVEEITGGCFCCRFDDLLGASGRLCAEAPPDVLVAEPVGSCTDLAATVNFPLRRWWGEAYDVAPYSVLVDPHRLAATLGLAGPLTQAGPDAADNTASEKPFSEKVLYVYRKQLEEADLLVINKLDLLGAGELQRLRGVLAKRYPRAEVLAVSCLTGEGLPGWFGRVLTGRPGTRPAMEIDYDTYAEGEALLGWLNAEADVLAANEFDADDYLLALARAMRRRLAAGGVEIAHLKMTLAPQRAGSAGADDRLAAVSLTSAHAEPRATSLLLGTVRQARLTINLRAEADPAVLRRETLEALKGEANTRVDVREIAAFRPGRPTPTHRLTIVGTVSDP